MKLTYDTRNSIFFIVIVYFLDLHKLVYNNLNDDNIQPST